MKEQRKIELIGFELNNYKNLKVVKFTPDLCNKRLIRVNGDIGQGKSALLQGLQIATSGASGVDKKDELNKDFLSEVQLIDGEIKLFLGAKMREKKNGEKSFETFLYAKDDNGKHYTPVIDGQKASAKEYMEMLNTDITFRMSDLFSENQTIHRKFIEKIFADDLAKLGIDEVIEAIRKAKDSQDRARSICDARGSFSASFEKEGWNTEELAELGMIDIDKLRRQITEKEIEKDRLLNATEKDKELARTKLQSEKDAKLREIKEKALAVTEKVRRLNETKTREYETLKECYSIYTKKLNSINESHTSITEAVSNCEILTKEDKDAIFTITHRRRLASESELGEKPTEPTEPKTIPIEFGVITVPQAYDSEYQPLLDLRQQYLSECNKVDSEPLKMPNFEKPDTTHVDADIERIKAQVVRAEKNNEMVGRYNDWVEWISAKGLYEKEIDKLRKLYAKVDTGVPGLNIIPKYTNSGRVEIWMMYSGVEDPEFFKNPNGDMRHITGNGNDCYSWSQKGVIGLLLQAARLDRKPKALRLAILDDVPICTEAGLKILSKIQDKYNLQIITTHTDSNYNKEDLDDGIIVVENGEVFFN